MTNLSDPKPTYEELEANAQTQQHINLVRKMLRIAAMNLLLRGEMHDISKFSPEEAKVFAEYTSKLKDTTYNSQEYKACLREMKPALDHHYASNRHHPEHHENGISGMNLIDLFEMFVDWLASTKRHADGDILRSIEENKERFGMSDQLVQILRNTARDFKIDPDPIDFS
jgi:hypothetical protein